MCHDCLKQVQPDRGTTTYEGGSYFLNYKGCPKCQDMMIKNINKTVEESDDGEETISLTHICNKCEHVICQHLYNFRVEDGYQEYSMTCDLCGTGEDSSSVNPNDPRKITAIF